MAKDQLALRIRAFRKLKGYTQLEFAEELGVSVAVLGAIERGARAVDDKMLLKIVNALDIESSELLV
jgi:transcriptional regulator with XRE-family HTH domain